MASKRSTLQTKLAAAALRVAQKVDGVQVSLSHQGGAGTTLWAVPGDPEISPLEERGALVEAEARDFSIPLQSGFAAGGLSEGDEITWGSDIYVVSGWDTRDYDSVYVAHCWRREPRRVTV